MKALVCEMCNSSDLVKQDGFFVCQHCGMKYTPEEAKKMIVEGTVKVDNTDAVQKYLANARRAKQKEDWEETEKYYNLVEQNDPSNIEAIFYSSYGKARACLCVNEIFKREAIFKALVNSVSILDDNYNAERAKDLEPVIEDIVTDVIGLYDSEFVYTQHKNGYGQVTSDDSDKTYQLFLNVICEMFKTLEQILEKLSKNTDKLSIYKQQLKLAGFISSVHSHASHETRIRWYDKSIFLTDTIKRIDASYAGKDYRAAKAEYEANIAKAKRSNKIGCLIGFIIALAIFVGSTIFFVSLFS